MDVVDQEVHNADFIPQQVVKAVYNPFSICLRGNESSMKDGLKTTFDSQEPGYAIACWGATIAEIYPIIYMHWDKFKLAFQNSEKASELLKSSCMFFNCIRFDCSSKEEIHFQAGCDVDLGPVPRDKYPLVLFLVAQSLEMDMFTSHVSDETNVVAHAIIFHLRDDICQLESHTISHFVRCFGGKPCDLKQLYTSGRDPASEQDDQREPDSNESNNSTPDACVICQINPVNKVFLPCRHTCVCENCFQKVDKCPMCRGVIQSCFSLNDELNSTNDHFEEDDNDQHWIYRLNNRINKFFGFT